MSGDRPGRSPDQDDVQIRPSDLALCGLIVVTALNVSAILTTRYGIAIVGKVAFGLVAAALLIEMLRRQRTAIKLDRLSISIPLIYLLAAGLVTFWAYSPNVAVDRLGALYRDALVAFLVVAVIDNFASLRLAVRGVYLTLASLALLSAIQMLTGSYEFDFGGLAVAGINHLAGEEHSWRLYGPFDDPNSYGRILLIGIPMAVQELFSPSVGRGWKAAALLSLTVLLAALVGTYSRGALLGLIVAAVPFAVSFRRYWLIQAVAVVLVVLLVSHAQYGDRIRAGLAIFSTETSDAVPDSSMLGRWDEMRLAAAMFKDNIVGGLGPGGYSERFQRYSSQYQAIPRHEDRQAHSLPLEIAAEGGLIMLAAFAALCVLLTRNVAEAFRTCRLRCPQEAALVAGIGLAMVGYLAASLVLHADFSRLFWLLCGLILTLPVCVSRHGPNVAPSEEIRIPLSRSRVPSLS